MNTTAQKILKIFHLTFAGISLGGMAATLLLLLIKLNNPNFTYLSEVDYIIYILNNNVTIYSVYGTIVTTLIFALYTNWGFIKYHWVIIKWALLILLAIVFIWMFIPTINGMASLSDAGLHQSDTNIEYLSLLSNAVKYNVIVFVIYITLYFVSTIKPFGKRNKDIVSNRKRARLIVGIIVIIAIGFNIMGTVSLNKLRNMTIANSDPSSISNGVYVGKYYGGGGPYTAKVTVSDNRIIEVELRSERESKYVRYALPVSNRIIAKQNANVDAITGATTTSKCFMKAVEQALSNTNETAIQ